MPVEVMHLHQYNKLICSVWPVNPVQWHDDDHVIERRVNDYPTLYAEWSRCVRVCLTVCLAVSLGDHLTR